MNIEYNYLTHKIKKMGNSCEIGETKDIYYCLLTIRNVHFSNRRSFVCIKIN